MSTAVKRAVYTDGNFTATEAIQKLGKQVHLTTDSKDLLRGAIGRIVDYHETGESRFDIVIRWNAVNGVAPAYERFSKSSYHRLISER